MHEKTPDPNWAKCVELDGCFTQGKTLDELKENMHGGLNLHLDEPANSKTAFAPP
ncbi:MAG: type II toxin-antitoxin system HicB family antitoxin [Proteobacteria bacterium]|nr:type II toxin-antitoxin system HicB family antitoxin [Pseudomonadota bacterium]